MMNSSVRNESWSVDFKMSVNKIQKGSVIFGFKDNFAKVFSMDYTTGEIVQRGSELMYSSGRGSETVLYNISNRFDIFLRLWYFGAKEVKISVVRVFYRFHGFSEKILLAMRVGMSFFKSLLSLHSLKIERALHPASFNGPPRIKPAPPDADAATNTVFNRRCLACPVCPLYSSCSVGGGAKDLAIWRSSR